MLCEKKEALIRKGLLRNQQPRVFMSNVHKLIDLLVNSKTTTEEIMKSVDKWIADYDPRHNFRQCRSRIVFYMRDL